MAGADLGPDLSLAKRLSELERAVRGLNTRDVLLNSAMPVPTSGYAIQHTTGLSGGDLYLNVPIAVPPGRTKVTVTAIANLYFLGVAGGSGYVEAYIEANGTGFIWSSPGDISTRASALGGIVNTASPVLGFQQENLEDDFLIALQVSSSVPSDFPDSTYNYASITVTCLFYA